MTTRSGSGTWRPGPRPPASRVIPTAVTALCLLPDGRLASGARDNTIRLWDVAAGAETARLEGHSGAVAALCLLADGRLASGVIGQHDPALGRGGRGRDRPPRGSFRPGHRPLPAGGRAARLGRLGPHDPALGRRGRGRDRRPRGSFRLGHRPCLLPDGRLASGSYDNTIRLWDVAAGAETARLEGHSRAVAALCLLADGRLASGAYENTIRLWDVAAGAETARLEGHSARGRRALPAAGRPARLGRPGQHDLALGRHEES